MAFLKNTLFLSLALAGCASSQTQPEPTNPELQPGGSSIQPLLESLLGKTLHIILHDHLESKFQDGIFETDTNAIEAIHNTDPPLASRLLSAAHLDLLRRQTPNSTTPPEETTPSDTSSPPQETTPPSATSTAHIESSLSPPSSTDTPPTNPPVNDPSIDLPTPSSANNPSSTGPSPPISTITDPSIDQGTTTAPPSRLTTTTRPGSSLGASVVSSVVLSTSTMPDGRVEVVTSYTVVGGEAMRPTGTGAVGGREGDPQLQGGGGRIGVMWVMVGLAGAVGMAVGM
ncbi:hypothetical protein P152DRAFT_187871 [Eremomyces bilateralis CBS 781.70]|uniref:FAS1 domain-containing protein n=1 Tax=Eremomyces bilateralis CBS 781.70 TaxID=1392243 RepID=A0A6G1GBU5_9PEZI|nr:uncharacterized protein P152DRAFT_187871 [Eremomyces bilateralis CBS 781.70]KAF1815523.1 hypothetical protein P152DRAFT_187871 [Eremomyces bilateralis CBS 781.70]